MENVAFCQSIAHSILEKINEITSCIDNQLNIINLNQQLSSSPSSMQPSPSDLHVHAFSAFKRTFEPHNFTQEALAQLDAYCQQVASTKKKVALLKAPDHSGTTQPLTHLLMDVTYSLQASLRGEVSNSAGSSADNVSLMTISLLKNLCILIQQCLILTECKYTRQLMSSMLFQKGLVETFNRCFLSQKSPALSTSPGSSFTFVELDSILSQIGDQDYRRVFLPNVYALHSGSALSIERTNFSRNLKCVVTNIGKTFTEKTNLITRNLKNVKKSKFINEVVSSSIKTICNYKNDEFINEEVARVTIAVFGKDGQTLPKEEFLLRLQKMLVTCGLGKEAHNFTLCNIFLYIDLFRVETLMVHDSELAINVEKQKEINSSNFYTQEMQKLLKKCPYNGDECCDCKKCQCVRRNRQSAKLSQEKKRNAVEQLDPMKKRIEELQQRNRQLEEENRILRGIVKELKSYQGLKSAFNSTIESVSKVLDD